MVKWREIYVISFSMFCVRATFAELTDSSSSVDLISLKCNTSACSTDSVECQEVCGCDGIYIFDDSKGECVIDYEYLKKRTRSNNLMQTENDVYDDDELAKKILESTERVFRGIIYCAIFFVICASLCVVSVCVFCCHIHNSDVKLKNDVKALANKLNVDYKKKESIKNKPRDQKEESCNVVVEDANIMCV